MRYSQVVLSNSLPRKFVALATAIVFGLAASGSAFAHNIVSGVYADGMMVEGEIGFSNGDMAAAGVMVEVLNDAGEKLGETALVEGGMFAYQASAVQKHIFKANLSSGHIAEMVIEADELSADTASTASGSGSLVVASAEPANNSTMAITADASNTPSESAGSIALGVTATELQAMIRSTVAQQVRPLQKELRAYKEKVMFRDIAGGLGFIFGLFGVAAWMASKRKNKDR